MSKHQQINRHLQFESLECRTLMTATPGLSIDPREFRGLSPGESNELRALAAMGDLEHAAATAPSAGEVSKDGTLMVHGCAGNDTVTVVNLGANQGTVRVTQHVNGERNPMRVEDFTGVRRIIFMGYEGNNYFYNNTTLPSKALGGSGEDKFLGGRGNDVFFGLGGNDWLEGRDGSDNLYGGRGHDTLPAGGDASTRNVLKGGAGNDKLFGSLGFDDMSGNGGDDRLRDDNGNGCLNGGPGNDVLYAKDYPGRRSHLTIHGGGGNDRIIVKAGEGDYRLFPAAIDDYFDDDVFLAKNRKLRTLTAGQVEDWLRL